MKLVICTKFHFNPCRGKNAKMVAPRGGGGSTFVEAFFADELGKMLKLLTEITVPSP